MYKMAYDTADTSAADTNDTADSSSEVDRSVADSSSEADSDPDDEKLDTEWLEDFKDEECVYHKYYKEPVTSIQLYFLYIENKELIDVDRQQCVVENGILKKEVIVSLIKEYQRNYKLNNYKLNNYKLNSLLRYNIDLNPEDITDYLNETKRDRFLTPEKYLDDIHFDDSIAMLQDLNALYFIYTQDSSVQKNQTRRIVLSKKIHKTVRHKKNLKIAKEIK
jgi:hypothetical protein